MTWEVRIYIIIALLALVRIATGVWALGEEWRQSRLFWELRQAEADDMAGEIGRLN